MPPPPPSLQPVIAASLLNERGTGRGVRDGWVKNPLPLLMHTGDGLVKAMSSGGQFFSAREVDLTSGRYLEARSMRHG